MTLKRRQLYQLFILFFPYIRHTAVQVEAATIITPRTKWQHRSIPSPFCISRTTPSSTICGYSTCGSVMSNHQITNNNYRSMMTRRSLFIGQQITFQKRRQRRPKNQNMVMLRNFDLPEAIIFYGTDTVVDLSEGGVRRLQPGVKRLLNEVKNEADGTKAVLISESLSRMEMVKRLGDCEDGFAKDFDDSVLTLLGCDDDNDDEPFILDCSPSPGLLMKAIERIEVKPRGFGGSSGFGSKQADPIRPPLPKHVVVFVTGPNSKSRHRCSAARAAGMRVVYLETQGMGTCDAEDLVDGVVETLGETNVDWEVVTLDSVATPGDFWLNPPNPRDDEGNRVDSNEVVEWFRRERAGGEEGDVGIVEGLTGEEDEFSEEDISSILADLDPL